MQTIIAQRLGTAIALTALGALGAGCASSSSSAEEGGDVQAMCALFDEVEGPEDITLDYLDDLLDVALPEVRPAIQEIRDAVAEDGQDAFEDAEVMDRFDEVGAYAGGTCGDDG